MDATQVTVRDVRSVGADTVALELETPDGFDAKPGQFVLLRATVDGEEVSRHYTLSSPDVEGTFEITVGVDPDGDLSPWLADLDAGDEVSVEGPFGTVFYEDEDVVLLAGGPGVGPAVGMGERALADGHDVAIVYQDDSPAHEERLAALSAGGATVIVTGGSLDEAVAEVAGGGQVYVFGFREFVDDSLAAVEAAGGDPDDAKVENFG
ncbi:oxidoreductase [Halostella sp. JP-L12]|uniref:ferredoxin--NADP reductase n=1 Tax=Halostella TaxID=1843185 RepID=UPI000EF79625|nr:MULTISPECIES: FAD-binding oxidoreductase [Halostella]NHN47709.1 oxidoreductase [Halostella sp. JP-L12]